VVPADLGWSDVGDWDAVATIRGHSERSDGATVLDGPGTVLTIDAPGSVVAAHKRVVVVGLEGAVVVETDDAILVTTREHAQKVKDAVDMLPGSGLSDLL